MQGQQDKPVYYKQWRQLWHDESKYLGWDVVHCFDGRRIVIDRHLWKRLHRLKRIRARLSLESEVMDETFCEALLEAMELFGR